MCYLEFRCVILSKLGIGGRGGGGMQSAPTAGFFKIFLAMEKDTGTKFGDFS